MGVASVDCPATSPYSDNPTILSVKVPHFHARKSALMHLDRRAMLGSAAAAMVAGSAKAQTPLPVVTIGVLNDMTGPLSADGGMGSAACVKQAIEDLGPLGFDVRVVSADHQNKPDIGTAI